MATLRAYPNGLTVHVGGTGTHTRAKRGTITGWSAAAVRRHTRWLYSIDAPGLTGEGFAITLTLRDCPPSPEAWTALRRAWIERARRLGAVRWHWVVEWQRRGTPHLHAAVYFPVGTDARVGHALLAHWLAAAAPYSPGWGSQTVKPIAGSLGWLQYLSKHAARGVKHYQRTGKPAGWETTGRLWGHGGDWPELEPLEVQLTTAQFHRFRRLARSWRVADARAAGLRGEGWQRLRYSRRMLRTSDVALSRYRGVSEWIPEAVAVRLLDVVSSRSLTGGPTADESRVRAA